MTATPPRSPRGTSPVRARATRAAEARHRRHRRPAFEECEGRTLLSFFTVTSGADSGPGTLREMITLANQHPGDDTIFFRAGVSPVTLDSGQLDVNDPTGTTTVDGGNGVIIARSAAVGTPQFGIFNIVSGSRATLARLTITGGDAAYGGGVRSSGTLQLVSCSIFGNTAVTGGGVYSDGPLLSVVECRLTRNRALQGGGIFSHAAALEVAGCMITDNTAGANTTGTNAFGGGVVNVFQGTIVNSTVYNNTSTGMGGGVYSARQLTLTNCTVYANQAPDKYFSDPKTKAVPGGGGFFNVGTLVLNNTIVAGSPSGDDLAGTGTVTGRNNIVDDNSAKGTGLAGTIKKNPGLNVLWNNGGPTLTLAVSPGSPAVDAGDTSVAVDARNVPLAYDQRGRGYPRVVGASVDIGAYEATEAPSTVVTTDADVVSPTDGLTSLREAVSQAGRLAAAGQGPVQVTFSGVRTATLTLGPITVPDGVTVTGGARGVTVARESKAGTPVFRLFNVPAGVTAQLDHLTLSNGQAPAPPADGSDTADGGAVRNLGTLVIDTCTLTGNAAPSGDGGAVHNEGTLTLLSTDVVKNSSGEGGGAVNYGTLLVSGGSFTTNTSASDGGAVVNASGGTMTLASVTVSRNKAATVGGGVVNYGVLTHSGGSIDNNQSGSDGGGLYNTGPLTVDSNAAISSNTAVGSGGGLYNSGDATVASATVQGNKAGGDGGGIVNTYGTMNLGSPTVAQNSANSTGGGLANFSGTVTVDSAQFTLNTANVSGGAVFNTGALTAQTLGLDTNRAPAAGGIMNASGTVTAAAATFTGNAATNGSGGAVFSDGGTVTLHSGTFTGNSATNGSGGAVYGRLGVVTLGNTIVTTPAPLVTFRQNSATSTTASLNGVPLGTGGAVFATGRLNAGNTLFDANTSSFPGGALYNAGPTVVVSSTFTLNRAGTDGGAVYAAGPLSVRSSTLSTNTAGASGGAVYAADRLGLSNCTVSSNAATTTGGAIFTAGNASVVASVLDGNHATNGTGAVANVGALLLSFSKLRYNAGGGTAPGAVSNGGTMTALDCTLSNNTGSNGGAISSSGLLDLSSSTLSGNRAVNGGALYNFGTMTVTNSTLSGNTATPVTGTGLPTGRGGGIAHFGLGSLTVVCSTLAFNYAAEGAGVYGNALTAPATLNDTIVANPGTAADLAGTFTGRNNLVRDGSGTGLAGTLVGDPKLGPLADNGGATQTHAIGRDSPAFDRGDTSLAVDAKGIPLTYDQRYGFFPRLSNTSVDIGAYEYLDPNLVVTTSSDTVDPDDGVVSLREAVDYANHTPGSNVVSFGQDVFRCFVTAGEIVLDSAVTVRGQYYKTEVIGPGGQGLPGFRVFRVTPTASAALSDLKIRLGSADQGGGVLNDGRLVITGSSIYANRAVDGGGVYNSPTGWLRLSGTDLSGNYASNAGGGLRNLGVAVIDSSSTVFANEAGSYGGGIENDGTLTVADSSISGNTAVTWGGGIFSEGDTTVTNSSVASNTSGVFGGGLLADSDTRLTVTGSTFTGNVSGQDAGISNFGTARVERTTLSGNRATAWAGGGIGNHSSGVLDLIDSRLTGNTAYGEGGGLSNIGVARVADTEFSGNKVTFWAGGGLWNHPHGTLTVTRGRIADNSAYGTGGGLFNEGKADLVGVPVAGNVVTDWAGGGVMNTGRLTVTDGSFQGNNAPDGGGVWNDPTGSATFLSTTFTDNHAYRVGGGAILSKGQLFLVGGRFSYNSATHGGAVAVLGGSAAVKDVSFDHNEVWSWAGAAVYAAAGATLDVSGASVFSDNTSVNGGGGIHNEGTATVTGATFTRNRGDHGGGGFWNMPGATATLANCDFNDNQGWYGGAIANSGTMTVTGTAFDHNVAPENGGAYTTYGPGIATFTDCTFTANTGKFGGALANDGVLTLTRCLLADNTSPTGAGGAISNAPGGDVTLTASTLRHNSALAGGAILNGLDATLRIAQSTFERNFTTLFDGGAVLNAGWMHAANATFATNSAVTDGGAINTPVMGVTAVTSSTFSDNFAAKGGGLNAYGPTSLTNTIVANSRSGGDLAGAFTGGFNLVEDGSGGLTDSITLDPSLGPLADNGGPTQTFALLADSPALDKGSNDRAVDAADQPLRTDQRGLGFDRVVGDTVDIGAFEYADPAPAGSSAAVLVAPGVSNVSPGPADAGMIAGPAAVLSDPGSDGQATGTSSTSRSRNRRHGA